MKKFLKFFSIWLLLAMLVYTVPVLASEEVSENEIVTEEVDFSAINSVMEKIDAIGEVTIFAGERIKDARDAYDKLSKYIEYIHVKDAAKDGENVPAGEGAGKIEEILKIAFKNGYSGFLSLEPHLFHFKGLDDLETEEIAGKKLSSGQTAFITAHKALTDILERII